MTTAHWTEKILWVYILLIPFSEKAGFILLGKRIGWLDIVALLPIAFAGVNLIIRKKKPLPKDILRALFFMPALSAFSFINSVNLKLSLIELSGLIYVIVFFCGVERYHHL